jgi:hypothetical protein
MFLVIGIHMLRSIFTVLTLCLFGGGMLFAQNVPFYYDTEDKNKNVQISGPEKTDIGTVVDKTVINPDGAGSNSDSVLYKLLAIFGIEGYIGQSISPEDNKARPAFFYIQFIINTFLGFASFIAFVVIVFGFYQMFFAGDESAAYSQAQAKVK